VKIVLLQKVISIHKPKQIIKGRDGRTLQPDLEIGAHPEDHCHI
jgi:hypothetical protein